MDLPIFCCRSKTFPLNVILVIELPDGPSHKTILIIHLLHFPRPVSLYEEKQTLKAKYY